MNVKLIKFRVVIRFAYSLLIMPRVDGGGGGVAVEFPRGGGRRNAPLRHIWERGDKEERDGAENQPLIASLTRLSSKPAPR